MLFTPKNDLVAYFVYHHDHDPQTESFPDNAGRKIGCFEWYIFNHVLLVFVLIRLKSSYVKTLDISI